MKKKLFLSFGIIALFDTGSAMLDKSLIDSVPNTTVEQQVESLMSPFKKLSIVPKIGEQKLDDSSKIKTKKEENKKIAIENQFSSPETTNECIAEMKLYSDDELEKIIPQYTQIVYFRKIPFGEFLYIDKTKYEIPSDFSYTAMKQVKNYTIYPGLKPIWANDSYMVNFGQKRKNLLLINGLGALTDLFVKEIEKNIVEVNNAEALEKLYYCPDGVQRIWSEIAAVFQEISLRFFAHIYDAFHRKIGLNEMIYGAILSGRALGRKVKLWNVSLDAWKQFGGFGNTIDRILICGMMLSNKFNADVAYNNKAWNKITGLSLLELYNMESEFLMNVFNGKCWVKEEEIQSAQQFLIRKANELANIGKIDVLKTVIVPNVAKF